MKKLFYFLALFLISVSGFSQNYTVIENAVGLKGYVNSQNETVIPCKYMVAGQFINDLAIVKLKDKFGVINRKDIAVIPFEYDFIEQNDKGLFKVKKDNQEFYLNKKGKKVKYKE